MSASLKTHCPQGHLYDEENTYVSPRGFRSCRTCARDRGRARAERQRRAAGVPIYVRPTHCPSGHEYDESNTHVRMNGARSCRACQRDAATRTRLMRRYGITQAQFDEMLESQGGVCAVCGTLPDPPEGMVQSLHVDHDHETGVVRGLLCFRCNAGAGLLGDDLDRVLNLYTYLLGHERVSSMSE